MISLVLAAALFAAGEPAAAQGASPAAPPAKAEKANKDGLVCRKETVVGSRLPTRVCMTQAEWDERQRQDRELARKTQSLTPPTRNN